MTDRAIAIVRAKLKDLFAQVAQRRKVSRIDPIADAIDYCVSEVERTLHEFEHSPPPVTVDEYAAAHRVTVQTVRTWCRKGLLPAQQTAKGWLIPADAERVPRSSDGRQSGEIP